MQRFSFPLEQALRWRSSQLDIEQAKLTALRSERESIGQSMLKLREAERATSQEMMTRPVLHGEELSCLAGYREGNQRRLVALADRSRDCDHRIAHQLKGVIEADRAKRLLDKLKERRLEEWNYESAREIESTASELFLARWGRKR